MRARVAVLLLLAVVAAAVEINNKVMVVLSDINEKESYSHFFDFLQSRGYELSFFKGKEAPGLTGYSHFISFAPDNDFTGELRPEAVIEFIDAGGNAIIATQITYTDSLSKILEACGFVLHSDPALETIALVDHFHYYQEPEFKHPHHVIAAMPFTASQLLGTPMFDGSATLRPILYKGTCATLAEPESPLHTAVLRGTATSYCADPRRPLPANYKLLAGTNAVLAAALQARNNARVMFSGSVELFSNKFFDAELTGDDNTKIGTGNRVFCEELAKWTFQERGRLRIREAPTFIKTAGLPNSEEGVFTVKDTMKYTIKIDEWDSNTKTWAPYTKNDVQLEVTMLDPYIRTDLATRGDGVYTSEFQLPDVYGIFTLRITYRRLGYSWLIAEDRVPIRPLRHNQFERFIPSAFPFYVAALSMIVGVALVSFVFLFHKDEKKRDHSD